MGERAFERDTTAGARAGAEEVGDRTTAAAAAEGAAQDKEQHDEQLQPQIYVASLSDYNAGWLHGEWLDATLPVDELEARISAMLQRSRESGAEEWAIHDYDSFGGLRLGEYEDLAVVQRLAVGIQEHGAAFAVLADVVGTEAATSEAFTERYLGEWDSREAYAADLLEDLAGAELAQLSEWTQIYVQLDADGFGRDLELSGDIYTARSPNGIWVFSGLDSG